MSTASPPPATRAFTQGSAMLAASCLNDKAKPLVAAARMITGTLFPIDGGLHLLA